MTDPEYTHIVVGAGSAGCVLAARLSDSPDHHVLLLEAGPSYRSAATPAEVASPDNFAVLAGIGYTWPTSAWLTAEQGRQPYPQGRGVGGSSAVNHTWALRPRPGDLVRWAEAGCDVDWSELHAALVDTERDLDFGADPGHGGRGPMTISRAGASDWGPVDRAFRATLHDAAVAWSPDLNAVDATGAGPIPMTVCSGRRVSTNDAFLEPARGRPNLEIRAGASVRRVVFDRHRSVGVVVDTDDGEEIVRADRIVLSAGALHTPALLLRSGVGPPDELRRAGIEPVVPLPGVGRNLVDQPLLVVGLPLSSEHQMDDTDRRQGNVLLRPGGSSHGDEWHVACLNTSPLGPSLGSAFVALMHPESRGQVRLARARPGDDIEVRFNCLATANDLDRLWTGLEQVADLVRHPAFGTICSGPAAGVDGRPLDLAAIRPERAAWMRRHCISYRHAAGSCRMGHQGDEGAVVDHHHGVIGTDNLSVVDASVMPEATSSNTNLTVIALAHRAAHLLSDSAPVTATEKYG